MVADRKVSAVLCSADLARSQEFYEQMVGLKLSPETIKNHLLFDCGDGTTLLVYGRPTPNQADHTQVRFWSSNAEAECSRMAARGVVFEDYDFPALKTVAVVCDNSRHREVDWFRDPDGNTLALFQPE